MFDRTLKYFFYNAILKSNNLPLEVYNLNI
ncbi:hypothetical protein SAMN05444146_1658 [Flavobacterium johnsoniae]|nr:hypothetical protein SAMN05444146_1658 [Flavobacterium johnsoniae]